MTDLCSTPATSNESDRSRPPRSRRRLLLKAMPDGTPSRDAESGDTWSVRNVNSTPKRSGAEATGRSEKSLVEDSVAVFRGARPQTDSGSAADEGSTDTLDYFAPAFRRVLGAEQQETETTEGAGREEDAETQGRTESLDYFTPAFRAVLREEAPTTKASADTGSEDKECEDDEGPASLAYFAPALP
jgi:hypothetical protein